RIRLTRTGKRKEPHYRVVVADQRSPRDGRFIEIIGKYHPLEDPSVIEIDEERAIEWLRQGAQPSDAGAVLLRKVGLWEKLETGKTGTTAPSTTAPTTSTTTSTTTTSTTTDPTETAEPTAS